MDKLTFLEPKQFQTHNVIHTHTLNPHSVMLTMREICTMMMMSWVTTCEMRSSVTLTPATQERSRRPSFRSTTSATAVRPIEMPNVTLHEIEVTAVLRYDITDSELSFSMHCTCICQSTSSSINFFLPFLSSTAHIFMTYSL